MSSLWLRLRRISWGCELGRPGRWLWMPSMRGWKRRFWTGRLIKINYSKIKGEYFFHTCRHNTIGCVSVGIIRNALFSCIFISIYITVKLSIIFSQYSFYVFLYVWILKRTFFVFWQYFSTVIKQRLTHIRFFRF